MYPTTIYTAKKARNKGPFDLLKTDKIRVQTPSYASCRPCESNKLPNPIRHPGEKPYHYLKARITVFSLPFAPVSKFWQ